MHAIKIGTLRMHGVSRFHHLAIRQNLNTLSFLDCIIYQRKNLTYEKLSGSPIHNLFLGKINALAAFKHF